MNKRLLAQFPDYNQPTERRLKSARTLCAQPNPTDSGLLEHFTIADGILIDFRFTDRQRIHDP
jgi:hypothetical protein